MTINFDIENRNKKHPLTKERVNGIISLMNKLGILLYDKEKIGKYLVIIFITFRRRILTQAYILLESLLITLCQVRVIYTNILNPRKRIK
jgi:hypothetical protein